MLTKRMLCVVLLTAAALVVSAGISAGSAAGSAGARTLQPILSGRVYAGDVGLEPPASVPLSGVLVSLYCSLNPAQLGTFAISTTTDATGWYGLDVAGTCQEYYNILETNPVGHVSVGASSVSGTVRSADWIEYEAPLAGQTFTGNKFWDMPEADAGSLHVIPDPAQVGEPVEIRVNLLNDDSEAITRHVQFYWAEFGIGQERHPIGGRIPLALSPYSRGSVAVTWIPPEMGPYGFYAEIFYDPRAVLRTASFQHNVFFQAHPDPDDGQFVELFPYRLRNPLDVEADVMISPTTSPVFPDGWQVSFDPQQVTLGPGEAITASAIFTYAGGLPLPPSGEVIFEVHTAANGTPIGGFAKVFGAPLRLHVRPEPAFAESEISVNPYPVPAGEPAEICAEVRNVTQQPRYGLVHFFAAPFGIGQAFQPIAPPVEIFIPGLGVRRPCVHWVAPEGGQFAFEVAVETPGYPAPVISQRVMDVSKVLPDTISILRFPVRNPFDEAVTLTLGLQPHVPGWGLELSQDVLPILQPGESRAVSLTVTVPPDGPMPPDEAPVVDVMAYSGSLQIGGFRKIYRPPVPMHRPADPIYAESEIMVHPYPPQAHEPTEICVEVRNPTSLDQAVILDYRWAEFGIGLPWHPIRTTGPITVPAEGLVIPCTMWVPPVGGRLGFEIELHIPGVEMSLKSQRVIDVGEILLPNQPTPFEFRVANPHPFPITVTLGAIRHVPQWEVAFDPPVLYLLPDTDLPVVMTVIPVQNPGDPEPREGEPVIDVEAYWEGNDERGLLGGFRKLFFPPVPIHRPEDPSYAEREIDIFPYPPHAGEPTNVLFEARNPTPAPQVVTVTFEIADFGIGLPFQPIDVRSIDLPPDGTQAVRTVWVPPFEGEFCVRVRVEAPFFDEPFYSSRNVSIVRLPQPYGTSEVFRFAIGDNGMAMRPLTVTLGLRKHLPNWQVELGPSEIVFTPGQSLATAVLTITPPADPDDLPQDGSPVADVSAFANGELIGGIRKVWRPPVPLGQLGEPGYAESEITINPDPVVVGQPATFSAEVRNNSDYTQTIHVQFGWAEFGAGIPFSTTDVVPTQTVIILNPHMTTTVSAQWTPQHGGHYCVQIILTEEQTHVEQRSQRNVDPIEVPETHCEPFTRDFWLYNSTPLPVTVTIGASAINLPEGWSYSIAPTEAALGPFHGITITVTITPVCNLASQRLSLSSAQDQADGPAKIQVEGYDQDGQLIGGVELQLSTRPRQATYSQSQPEAGRWYDLGTPGARLWFDDVGGLDALTVTVLYDYPSVNRDGLRRGYLIEGNVDSGFTATLALYYEDDEVPAGVSESELQLYRYVGDGIWEVHPSTADPTDNLVTSSVPITGMGWWGIGVVPNHPTATGLSRLDAARSIQMPGLGIALGLGALLCAGAWWARRRQPS